MMKATRFAKTKNDLADVFGVSSRTIREWTNRPGFPSPGRQGYTVSKVREWRSANVGRQRTAEDEELVRERVLAMRAKRERLQDEMVPAWWKDRFIEVWSKEIREHLREMVNTMPGEFPEYPGLRDELQKFYNRVDDAINRMAADPDSVYPMPTNGAIGKDPRKARAAHRRRH